MYNCSDSFRDRLKDSELEECRQKKVLMKALYFSYIAKKSLMKDQLVYYFILRSLKFIQEKGSTDTLEALHFTTVLPHHFNEHQLEKLKPFIDAIDSIFYVNYYKKTNIENTRKISELKDELKIKNAYIRGIYGNVLNIKQELGTIANTNSSVINLITLTGKGSGLSIQVTKGIIEIINKGSNYMSGDIVYSDINALNWRGVFFSIEKVGMQDAAFHVDIDPVNAGLPIYVICYNVNATRTLNYDISILELIKWESCKYGDDYIIKKYIIGDQGGSNKCD